MHTYVPMSYAHVIHSEATIAAQKEYERMHEPTAAGDAGYRPTDSFNFHPSGIPPAQESYDSYEEKQF